MAYKTGSATDMQDLIAEISTFATANGWTEDRRDNVNGIFGLSKNSVFVSFRWDPGTPQILSIHQATAALPASGTEPGDATGDSGNGYNNTTSHTNSNLDDERHVDLGGDGPYPSYYFFEKDASPAYLHIVVEESTNKFQHFGFGELEAVGDGWTGGEYAYGQVSTASDAHASSFSTFMLDGLFNASSTSSRRAATIRVTGMPSQPAGSVWGQVWGNQDETDIPGDTAANVKIGIQGGCRGGPLTGPWGQFTGTATTGYIPMYSFACFYCNETTQFAYLLGWQPDVRGVAMQSFAPKDEITVGSDTWVLFPAHERSASAAAGTTGYMGIAYKKVTA